MRSDQQRLSRYVNGGKSVSMPNAIGWWERYVFETADSDVTVLITGRHHQRPDLLAYDLYGTPSLMWFVLQYNTILDINREFVTDRELQLPTKSRLFGEILTKTRK